MAGYLGNIPTPQATQTRDTFTATSGQTSFATSGYTVGMLDVYLNGIKLASADFTASNGSDVVLASGASTGDILEVVSFSTFDTNSGVFTGDFSVDSPTFKVDSSNNRVSIGTTSTDASALLTLNKSPTAAFGNPLLQIGGSTYTSGGYYSIGLGYTNSTYTEPPAEIAYVPTSDSGGTTGYLTFGTRSVTTNTVVTESMRIDGNGHVTMPKQSAFNAYLSSQQNNIAVNTNVTIQFATERFDQNADYDNSTYTFTAAVTGKYQLNATVYLMNVDTGASYYSLQLITSNDSYFATFSSNSFQYDADYLPFQISQLVDMDASDTAYVRVYQSNGSAQTDVNSNSFFSGYLVC